jgi:hypothetical protein
MYISPLLISQSIQQKQGAIKRLANVRFEEHVDPLDRRHQRGLSARHDNDVDGVVHTAP